MIKQHTEYIRKLSDETGKTIRELESMWKIAQDTYSKLQMMDPSKYQHLRETGSESQEIKNIFEKTILKLPETREENLSEAEPPQTEEMDMGENAFEDEISNEMPETPDENVPNEFTGGDDLAELEDESFSVEDEEELESTPIDEEIPVEEEKSSEDEANELKKIFNEEGSPERTPKGR